MQQKAVGNRRGLQSSRRISLPVRVEQVYAFHTQYANEKNIQIQINEPFMPSFFGKSDSDLKIG